MTFVRWVDQFNKYLMIFLGLTFAAMSLSFFINILSRFVFSSLDMHIPVPWSQEVARYLMVWSVFIGVAVASRNDKLISVEILVHTLPPIIGKVLKVSALLLTIVFFIYLIIIGFNMAFHQGLRQTSPNMNLPMIVVYVSMLVGAVAGIVNIVALLIETFLTKKDIRFTSLEEEEEDAIRIIEVEKK